jgi:diguanylate cyclase (GGDEF)-like protein
LSTTALLLVLTAAALGCALVACWRLFRVNRTLRHESVIDPLTGVLHYGKLQEILHTELERASRFDRPLSVLMVDLDLYREVNSQYGHQRGSAVLREFAQRVQSSIRGVDTLARFGGDEFVVVLPETGEHGVPPVADRICRIVREKPFAGDGSELQVQLSVSIGAALYGRHGVTVSQLLRSADEALYLAKQAGRDGWAMARAPIPLLPNPVEPPNMVTPPNLIEPSTVIELTTAMEPTAIEPPTAIELPRRSSGKPRTWA